MSEKTTKLIKCVLWIRRWSELPASAWYACDFGIPYPMYCADHGQIYTKNCQFLRIWEL